MPKVNEISGQKNDQASVNEALVDAFLNEDLKTFVESLSNGAVVESLSNSADFKFNPDQFAIDIFWNDDRDICQIARLLLAKRDGIYCKRSLRGWIEFVYPDPGQTILDLAIEHDDLNMIYLLLRSSTKGVQEMKDTFEKGERTAITEEPVTLLLVLGLVLCGVAILLLSDFVGVTVIGAFIGKLVGLSIVNASVVGYVTIGAVGISGLGLVGYSAIVRKMYWDSIASRNEELTKIALIAYTEKGCADEVDLLLRHGANINAADSYWVILLIVAAESGNIALVKLLLSRGVDANLARPTKPTIGYTALMMAVCNKHLEIVKLLLEHGAEVDAVSEKGHTALMYAAYFNYTAGIKLLLEHGAYIDAADHSGCTALKLAIYENNSEMMVELLLKRGAKVPLDLQDNAVVENVTKVIALEKARVVGYELRNQQTAMPISIVQLCASYVSGMHVDSKEFVSAAKLKVEEAPAAELRAEKADEKSSSLGVRG